MGENTANIGTLLVGMVTDSLGPVADQLARSQRCVDCRTSNVVVVIHLDNGDTLEIPAQDKRE